jgi:hypothetical protein
MSLALAKGQPSMAQMPNAPAVSRRQVLRESACGFGSLALAALCAEAARADNPLAPRPPHHSARVRRMIFVFLAGGPSHIDLFEPKPELERRAGHPLPFEVPNVVQVGLENTRLLGPIAKFQRHGESGLPLSEHLPQLGRHADQLCLLHAMEVDNPAHAPAQLQWHTGAFNSLRPSMGSWITYGLGTENQNLPGFITILPVGGERCFGCAFLPAIHQGTAIRSLDGEPIRYLTDPSLPTALQRKQLELIQARNRRQLAEVQGDQQMEGLIESFELAFRMQSETPKLLDLSGETRETLDLYGIGQEPTNTFGRECLLARRLSEAGVRFVQIALNGWDHHGQIRTALPGLCRTADRPLAGLLTDLKQRGLLDDTLVLVSGEFGRTPWSQDLSMANAPLDTHGREHNPYGFTAILAGGGVKAGLRYGATDEFGYRAVEGKVHIHDLHATLLHLLGLDHERLTYRHAGRDHRLTDVFGRVVQAILA